MTKPSRKLGAARGQLTHKAAAAIETKHRIRAIVDDVIAEMDKRRASKKFDYVAALADELEKGGLAAWRELRALLPKDEPEAGGGAPFNVQIGSLFAVVAAQVGARDRQVANAPPSNNMIEVTPSAAMTLTTAREVIETNTGEDDNGNGAVDW